MDRVTQIIVREELPECLSNRSGTMRYLFKPEEFRPDSEDEYACMYNMSIALCKRFKYI